MSTAERGPDVPGDLPSGRIVVPDDASALEPDRLAWLAEERAARRRRRLRRLLFTRRWERFGLSGPLVVLCLVATALVGGLTVAFVPHPGPEPGPAPLAAVPPVEAAAIGRPAPTAEPAGGAVLGHRLPDVALDADVRPVSATGLRPAVVVLVPRECACTSVLHLVYRQAREFRLALWLVAVAEAPGVREQLISLDEQAAAGGARWAVDTTSALSDDLAARGATLVAVQADGRVAALRRDLPLTEGDLPPLEPLFAGLAAHNR